ncbi:MAG: DUF262 domain-containing protein [Lysobacter sp.]
MKMTAEKKAIDKIYKRRNRYEIPDWQREKVWNNRKKQKLIDTILRGWKLPKFYFLASDTAKDQFEVLDGQQRLGAIWEFFDGSLKLSEESAELFGAYIYSSLPADISDAFDDYEIEFDVIENASEEDQKEFFQRLQEGLPLTSSEKLNSVHSKLRDFCQTLAKHKFFTERTSVSSKRYAYFDICAKCASIEIEGIDTGLRYEEIKSVFESNSNFSASSAAAKRLKSSLELLNKHVKSSPSVLKNRTIAQSIVTLTSHLLKNGLTEARFSKLANFIEFFVLELSRQVELGQAATDTDYLTFQRTVNANTRTGAKTRLTIMLKKLFNRHPDYFDDLGANATLTQSLRADVESSAKQIRQLIKTINELYSAKNGGDLFKATNKTAHALSSLGDEFNNVSGYKSFIENLYFLFRESTGSKLAEHLPLSFVEVNELRTLNEHDLDHGKSSKVSSKRKKLGTTYAKYFGAGSADTSSPNSFVVGQSNILAALAHDLEQMQKTLIGA